jgi:CBS-domain-containing membrane protein
VLKSLSVADVMHKGIFTVPSGLPVPSLVSQIVENPHNVVYTTDDDGNINGVISDNELMPIITEYDTLSKMLVAHDIAKTDVKTVKDTDNLDFVFKLLGISSIQQFPVKNSKGKIIGIVKRQDVISGYNKATMKLNVKDSFATELRTINQTNVSQVADGYSIVEKIVPKIFIGKNIVELKFRNKYGLEILMIKQRASILSDEDNDIVVIPDLEYRFKENDFLVLFGADQKIKEFKNKFVN